MNAWVKYLWIPIMQILLLFEVAEIVVKQKWYEEKYAPTMAFVIGLFCGIFFYGILLKLGLKIGFLIGMI